MEVAPLQLTFEGWCSRLHPSPIIAPAEDRSGLSSTDVSHRHIPVSIDYWSEFRQWVEAWKAEMIGYGLGTSRFLNYAGARTRAYTVGDLFPEVIRGEEDARRSLHEFYKVVNCFNYDYYQFLQPGLPGIFPYTEVYALPVVALGVRSSPDICITDGSLNMLTVGLGEVKAPWVLTRQALTEFMGRLPIRHFGEQFVAVTRNLPDDSVRVGKALTQIYSDLLTEGLSLGFLATTDSIIYCYIPPEDRSRLKISLHRAYRADRAWEFEPGRFTVQTGLSTLAWLAKTRFSQRRQHPPHLKKWGK
jgi:hypothetical protein